MNSFKRMQPLLGTFVEIGVSERIKTTDRVITLAFSAIEKIHYLLSFHNPDSDLSQLNRSQDEFIELCPISLWVLRLAIDISCKSNGLFNCTVGGILIKKGVLPNHSDKAFMDYGSIDDIELCGNRARLKRPVCITLDGIAKGYAVDVAVMILKRYGQKAGWVNAGGDLRVFGDYSLPVQRREQDGQFKSLGQLTETALATSVVSAIHDPRFPGLVVNTETQTPENGVWSVLARSAWCADALTKVAGLANSGEREMIVKKLGGQLVQPAG